MKYNVDVLFKSGRTLMKPLADKVELIPIGNGILSVIKDHVNTCLNVDTIECYVIEDAEEGNNDDCN